MPIKVGNKDVKSIPGVKKVMVGDTEVWPGFHPYLDIEPKILWVTPYGTNDVLSNTDWRVE